MVLPDDRNDDVREHVVGRMLEPLPAEPGQSRQRCYRQTDKREVAEEEQVAGKLKSGVTTRRPTRKWWQAGKAREKEEGEKRRERTRKAVRQKGNVVRKSEEEQGKRMIPSTTNPCL